MGGLISCFLHVWGPISHSIWPLLFPHHLTGGHGTRLSIRRQDPNNYSDTETRTLSTMNIPMKSWMKDSSSNSSSLSSSLGGTQGLSSSLTSSPVQSSFNPPGCPNCSSSSCTAAFNPSFSPCSSFSRMTELSASTRRKRTSSWSNVR